MDKMYKMNGKTKKKERKMETKIGVMYLNKMERSN